MSEGLAKDKKVSGRYDGNRGRGHIGIVRNCHSRKDYCHGSM